MQITELIILGLATWRVASIIVSEDGPWQLFPRLRSWLGVRFDERSIPYSTTALSGLVICIWCLSPWIGGLFVLGFLLFPFPTILIASPFALSAMAVIIERWVNG